MLKSAAACQKFLATEDPLTIARQIRNDQEACRNGKLPSLLVLHLQSLAPKQLDDVATELCPEISQYSQSLKITQYSGIIGGIKAHLSNMTHEDRLDNLPSRAADVHKYIPSTEHYETALKVLDFIASQDSYNVTTSTPLEDILTAVKESRTRSASFSRHNIPQVPIFESIGRKSRRKCYICQYRLTNPHSQYESLCKPCGDFNLASSNLSLQPKFRLDGKTALVTGARINLGFRTALRLLRGGAKVIISSRYPRDAALRYLAEEDSERWLDSLKIIGADFRAARDVFMLVEVVKLVLGEWDIDGSGKLDILINNAAQTWTDPESKEKDAIVREEGLIPERSISSCKLLCVSDYSPRVGGGTHATEPLIKLSQLRDQIVKLIPDTGNEVSTTVTSTTRKEDTSLAISKQSVKCSWFQTLHEIPYEDIISAHSVNTFAPLILIREFLPLMGVTRSETSLPLTTKSRAHIINVSAREGIFEDDPKSEHKNGTHLHTNIAKAALNMITETEAWPAWKERRVAINSVDPGYLSMPLETEKRGGKCPIGWEDGAGRVLWPIAVAQKGEAVWGRFLKDYGAYEVDVGVGR